MPKINDKDINLITENNNLKTEIQNLQNQLSLSQNQNKELVKNFEEEKSQLTKSNKVIEEV